MTDWQKYRGHMLFLSSFLRPCTIDDVSKLFDWKLLLGEEFASGTFVNFQKELIDGEMNVKVCNGFVSEIGKDIPAKEADGESVQICKFNKASAQILKDEIIKLVNNNMIDKFPAYAFKAVIERNGLKGIDTQGHIWFEIDVHDDYKHVMK